MAKIKPETIDAVLDILQAINPILPSAYRIAMLFKHEDGTEEELDSADKIRAANRAQRQKWLEEHPG